MPKNHSSLQSKRKIMAFTFFDLKYMHSGWRIVGGRESFVNNRLNSSLKFDFFCLKRKVYLTI